jgi:hypothetical protein
VSGADAVTILVPIAAPFVNMGVTALVKKATKAKGWKAFLLHIAATAATAVGATFFGINPAGEDPAAGMMLGAGALAASQLIFHTSEPLKGSEQP